MMSLDYFVHLSLINACLYAVEPGAVIDLGNSIVESLPLGRL